MLAIRMQRTGRSGHAQFRLIVQESRRSPKSGAVVAALGSYDPHTKQAIMDKEKATYYLKNGAQPSTRVARLLKQEGIALPDWVKLADKKDSSVRNPDKRRSTRPVEEATVAEEVPSTEAEPPVAEAPAADAEATSEEA